MILTQTVWNDVKKSNPPAYKTINSLCYERANCEFVVFLDDLHYMTHLSGFAHESREKRSFFHFYFIKFSFYFILFLCILFFISD